jgi:trehalose 6-phosphate phosphatase
MSAASHSQAPPPHDWRFAGTALLLDVDGTLLDIAPTPDTVVVAPGLLDDLRRLRDRLGGALAVVTGRPVEQVDALLGDAPHAVAGEHGGALRLSPGGVIERPPLPEPEPDWLAQAERLAAAHPGALLERKRRGFVLHYRGAPSAGPALGEALAALLDGASDRFQLMAAHMAWEAKPRGADKGTAVATLMRHAPFAGRRPIFIGDDVTDEDGMRVARAAGGAGLRVDEVFGDAAGVRGWLARLAAAEGDAWAGW